VKKMPRINDYACAFVFARLDNSASISNRRNRQKGEKLNRQRDATLAAAGSDALNALSQLSIDLSSNAAMQIGSTEFSRRRKEGLSGRYIDVGAS
jgi:hypothetical protein